MSTFGPLDSRDTEALLAPTIRMEGGWLETDADTIQGGLDSKRAKTLKPVLKYKQRDTGMDVCMSVEDTSNENL